MVGHYLNLSTILISVLLIGRTNFGLKVCVWCDVPLPSYRVVPPSYRLKLLQSPYSLLIENSARVIP